MKHAGLGRRTPSQVAEWAHNCSVSFVTLLRTRIALLPLLFLVGCAIFAQDDPAAALSKGKHYAIAYPATPTKDVPFFKSLSDGIAAKLTPQGLVRVPVLDVPCCNVQLSLVGKSGTTLRVVLLDIDAQQVYTKDFTTAAKGTTSRSADLIGQAIDDPKILPLLKGK